ncbi:MAG: rhodanese-like domain-containing protein [Chryseolinea sp.]
MSKDVTTQLYQSLKSKDFQQKLANTSDAILLDVRTDEEFKSEHIPNAININVMEDSFIAKIAALDKTKTYFVYCRSGGRSGSACSIMSKQGYNVYNLAGGISNWTGEVC